LAGGEAPDGLALHVAWLAELLDARGLLPQARAERGLDRTENVIETGLGVVGLVGSCRGSRR